MHLRELQKSRQKSRLPGWSRSRSNLRSQSGRRPCLRARCLRPRSARVEPGHALQGMRPERLARPVGRTQMIQCERPPWPAARHRCTLRACWVRAWSRWPRRQPFPQAPTVCLPWHPQSWCCCKQQPGLSRGTAANRREGSGSRRPPRVAARSNRRQAHKPIGWHAAQALPGQSVLRQD